MLSVKELSKKIRGKRILDNISFELKGEEIGVIQGKSGVGKSTLLKSIAGLIAYDEGAVNVGRQPYVKGKSNFDVGYVFQDYQLFPHFDVLANIAIPLNVVQKCSKKEAIKKASFWLDKFGLKEQINQNVSTLSGGQKQRVAIARALAFGPKVLILDEPSASLDQYNSDKLALILNSLVKEGIVILLSSHDKNFISKLNARVLSIFN